MISREEETIQQGITKRQTTGEKQLTFVAVLRIHCDREAEDFTREVNWKLEKQRHCEASNSSLGEKRVWALRTPSGDICSAEVSLL